MVRRRERERGFMKLIITSIKHDFTGLIDVDLLVDGKEYSFVLGSENDLEGFVRLAKYKPGKALCFVKKVNLNKRKEDIE